MDPWTIISDAFNAVYAYWGPWLFVLISAPLFLSAYAKTKDVTAVGALSLILGMLGYLFPPEFHMLAAWLIIFGGAVLFFRLLRGGG